MTKASNSLTSLLQGGWVPIIAGRRARLDASEGTGMPKITQGSGLLSSHLPTPHPTLRYGWGSLMAATDGRARLLKLSLLTLPALLLASLAFTAAPALAAAPEAPVITGIEAGKPSEATFHGVVNPNVAPTEAGFYEFVYRATTEGTCKGAGELKAPAAPAMFAGISQGEEVGAETVTGLKPDTEYAVCLLAYNDAKTESTPSAPASTFTTTPEPPVTEAPAPGEVKGTTAVLHGTLNPVKVGEAGTYEFYAQQSATECGREHGTPEPAGTMTGAKEQHVSATVTGLQPLREYTVCLVAINKAGEAASGSQIHFTTTAAPATIDSLSASHIKSSEATLEGTVNPNNQLNECHFQYVDEAEFLGSGGFAAPGTVTLPCSPEQLKGYGEQTVSPTKTEVKEGNIVTVPAPIGGLTQGTEYHYRIVTKNGKGEEATEAKTFRTVDEPEKQAATEITATTATLNGVLNPHNSFEAGTYEFLYKQSEGECTGGSVTPVATSTTESPQPVSAKIAGLQPGVTYTFCLLQRNAAEEEVALSAPEMFATPISAPAIGEEQVTHITETAATLQANIDPDGAETTYRFEYDTREYKQGEAAHGTSVTEPKAGEVSEAEVSIGAGTTPVPVKVQLTGLTLGATYYYRVVADNKVAGKTETVDGSGKTFTTAAPQTTNSKECPNEKLRIEQPYGQTLPDCRAYEMVSPVETGGNDATDALIEVGRVRASEPEEREAEGEEETPAITYDSLGSFAEPVGANLETQMLSHRNGKEGRWETRAIIAPLERDANGGAVNSYYGMFFTPGLTEGLTTTAAALTTAPEAAPAGLNELYLAGFPKELHEPISYKLVSQLPSSEEEYAAPGSGAAGVYPLGASRDLGNVVFATEPSGDAVGPLRESVAGRVVFVGVPNEEGQVWTGAGVGNSSAGLREGALSVWRAVSEDGSRVIFNYSGGQLYARVNTEQPQSPMKDLGLPDEECEESADACTVKLSAGAATYWGANTEDTKIFYVETGDLYEYKLPLGSVKGQAKPLTSGGEVQGVAQISEDGSYVYFVAKGVLKGEHGEALKNISGVEPSAGADNLYVFHQGEPEPIKFIATTGNISGAGPGGDSAVLAPGKASGARLAFTSGQSLTGYDNQQAATGECGEAENAPCSEVYLYDAETGALTCASCDPSGARPVGPSSLATGKVGAQDGASNYRPRDLLADGSLFFDSSDALVPHASDGRQNVYEYEDGHVYAISNVSGGQESFFLDASPDGQDVFFGSADQLLPEDTSDNVAVWDAREDGGFPVNVSAPPCTTGEACRVAPNPEPSIYGAGPSETFAGPGNLASPPLAVVKPKTKTVKCKKGDTKNKKDKCVPKKKKKAKKAKKSAHTNRRTR